jgi:hypothetical protein
MPADAPVSPPGTTNSSAETDKATAIPESAALRDLSRLDPVAGGMLVLPFPRFEAYLRRLPDEGLRQSVVALLEANVDRSAPAFISLCKTNYGGRLMGLRVPTLLAGVVVRDPSNTLAMVSSAVDVLNARYGWGLIPAKTGDSTPVIAIEGVTTGSYQRLGPSERPAFTTLGPWLIFGSNVDALRSILADQQATAASTPWRARIVGADEWAFLWLDLPTARDSLIKSLAVYDLLTYGPAETRHVGARGNMNLVAAWIESVQALGTLSADMALRGAEIEASFRLGKSPK